MADRLQLGDLQLAIMRILWERDEATVAEVHAALLEDRGLAPTTVATMLVKLERKGVVSHRVEGRKYVYRPTVSRDAVTQSMVGRLAARLFEGDVTALVAHLLAEHRIDPDEIAQLKTLIARREKEDS